MKTTDLFHYRKTKRLIIRPLQLADYENWMQSHTNVRPAQNEWDESSWADSELTLKKFKELLKKQLHLHALDKEYSFGIFSKDDGVLLGYVRLMDISRGLFQNAYIGYHIFNVYWGHGFAQEACTAALQIAFKDLNLHRVEAGIAPSNKRSIKTAKAIGLKKEGVSKKRLFINEAWVDIATYAATSEDFKIKYKFKKS